MKSVRVNAEFMTELFWQRWIMKRFRKGESSAETITVPRYLTPSEFLQQVFDDDPPPIDLRYTITYFLHGHHFAEELWCCVMAYSSKEPGVHRICGPFFCPEGDIRNVPLFAEES